MIFTTKKKIIVHVILNILNTILDMEEKISKTPAIIVIYGVTTLGVITPGSCHCKIFTTDANIYGRRK